MNKYNVYVCFSSSLSVSVSVGMSVFSNVFNVWLPTVSNVWAKLSFICRFCYIAYSGYCCSFSSSFCLSCSCSYSRSCSWHRCSSTASGWCCGCCLASGWLLNLVNGCFNNCTGRNVVITRYGQTSSLHWYSERIKEEFH